MKEKSALPLGKAQGRGRVSIRYTDAVTGRVLREVCGENHVFTPQFAGTTGFQATALKADLLLTQGGSIPDGDAESPMPFIPGTPIGYGRPGAEGTGLYRGTYRSAESWYNQTTRNGVSSKYVYDFLPTQALGRVDWVGLTAALGSGASEPAFDTPWTEFSSAVRVYDCERGVYYRAGMSTVDSLYHVKLYIMDCFSDSAERSVDLTDLAGLTAFRTGSSYPRTARVFLEQGGGAVYVLFRGTPAGTTTAVYKAVKVCADGAEVLGQWDITGGVEYLYATTAPGGALNDQLWWMVPSSGYLGYTRYTCDLAAGTITAVEIGLEGSGNLLRWDEGVAYVYGSCFWYPRRDAYTPADDGYSGYFLYGSPLFDMSSRAVHGLVPPSTMEKSPALCHVGLSPITACRGQWIKTLYSSHTANLPFAYTCYRLPEGTEDRPEGSAMTVAYELDITW